MSIIQVAKMVALNVALLGAGLGVLELVFGDWYGGRRLNQLNLIRNYDNAFAVGHLYETADHISRYRRDRYGLRGHYNRLEDIAIVTIGGSTTDQRYISEGETWQDVLAAELARNRGAVTIVNAGVDGQTTVGNLKNFEFWFTELPGFRPRYVLAYVGINDLVASSNWRFDTVVAGSLMETIKWRSALYHAGRTIWGTLLAKFSYKDKVTHRKVDFSQREWVQAPLQTDHERLVNPRLDAYEQRLRALVKAIRAFGAEPIFVTQVTRAYKKVDGRMLGVAEVGSFEGSTINGLDTYYLLGLLNRRTLRVCNEAGAVCIDLAGELAFEDSDFYDVYHNTPQGAAKIGRYLYQKMAHLSF